MKNYIKKGILNFLYKRELKNKPKKEFKKILNKTPVIAVIIDSRLNMEMNDFNFLADIFSISKEDIKFLWYKSTFFHNYSNHMRIDIDDISLTGKINEKFNLFFDQQYDILINVYQKSTIIMKTLSLKIKHHFAIGFTPVDLQLNDIVFDFNPQNIDIFYSELSKYLKIIYK